MSKEITKAKQIVHGLLVQLQAEVDSLVDAYDAIEFSLREQERILGERCATAEARVAELEVLNTLAESARQDERDAASGSSLKNPTPTTDVHYQERSRYGWL